MPTYAQQHYSSRKVVRLPKIRIKKSTGLKPCGTSYAQMMDYLKSL